MLKIPASEGIWAPGEKAGPCTKKLWLIELTLFEETQPVPELVLPKSAELMPNPLVKPKRVALETQLPNQPRLCPRISIFHTYPMSHPVMLPHWSRLGVAANVTRQSPNTRLSLIWGDAHDNSLVPPQLLNSISSFCQPLMMKMPLSSSASSALKAAANFDASPSSVI
jgi:hypothetical protein